MNRAELARQAWAILLSSPGLRHDFEPEYVADCAVKSADALLSALQITPETVAESQQVQAGLSHYMYSGDSAHGLTNGRVYSGSMMDAEFVFRDDDRDIRVWPIPHRQLTKVTEHA
jgi:hypothetical protein